MRRMTAGYLVRAPLLAVSLLGPIEAYAQDAAKGAALIAEALKAVGGEDKLRSVKTLEAKGDFKRAAGPTNLEGALQIRLETPDKLRRDEDISLPGGGPAISRTEVLNGTAVWDDSSGAIGGGGFFVRGRGGVPDGRRGGRAAIDPAASDCPIS